MTYTASDFPDYLLMLVLCVACSVGGFGMTHLYTWVSVGSASFLLITFALRHGCQLQNLPIVVANPWQTVVMDLVARLGNVPRAILIENAAFFAEQYLLRSGLLTMICTKVMSGPPSPAPNATSTAWFFTFGLFHISMIVGTAFRLISFVHHLIRHEHVFHFLEQTNFRKILKFLGTATQVDSSASLSTCTWFMAKTHRLLDHAMGLLHGLATGLLTHVVGVIPWYCTLMITMRSLSMFERSLSDQLGAACMLEASEGSVELSYHTLSMMAMLWVLRSCVCLWCHVDAGADLESSFVREHWIQHHTQYGFSYLHGPHHDAIPVAFMALAEMGPLEAFLNNTFRNTYLQSVPPLHAWKFTATMMILMISHQYVPGVFPYASTSAAWENHHFEHHFLCMFPLGLADLSDRARSYEADVWLSKGAFQKDSKLWKWFCEQVRVHEGVKDRFRVTVLARRIAVMFKLLQKASSLFKS